MLTRIIEANRRRYTLSMDEEVPLAQRFWAVIQARVVDELTGLSPRSPVRLDTLATGFTPRVSADGMVGLLARPVDVFPNLVGQSYRVSFTIRAEGFMPHHLDVVVPQDTQFPGQFTPLRLGNIALHRQPVVMEGRTLRHNNGVVETVPNALVEVTGLWRVLVPAAQEGPPEPLTVVSLEPPLYFARTTATGQLQSGTAQDILGEDKALLAWTHAGADRLSLSDTINLAAGSVVLIDTDPERQEYVTVAAVPAVGPTDVPAEITLTHPLAHTHRPEARVRRVVHLPAGLLRNFIDDAIAGDTCVFLNDLVGLNAPDLVVEVSGGTTPDGDLLPNELHRLRFFTTTSDANPATEGHYQLPPLSRVARLQLRATAALTIDHALNDPLVPARTITSDPTPNVDDTLALDSAAGIVAGQRLIVGAPGAQEVMVVNVGGVVGNNVTFTTDFTIDHDPNDPVVPARTITSDPTPNVDDTITLDSAAGIVAGQRLIVGAPGAQEVMVVAVGGVAGNDVTFNANLTIDHDPNDPVVPARTITSDPAQGDNSVTLDSTAGIVDGQRLIVGAPGTQEVMVVDVGGVVGNVVSFTAGGEITFIPNYLTQVNRLDIEF